MPTPNKRSVLRVLTRATLLDIGRRHGLDVRVSDDHRSLVNAIAGSRKAGLEDIVRGLSRDELKKVCRQHDLDDSGRSKRPIADRILGLEEAPALPGIVGERAGGPTQQPTVDSVIAELPLETLKQIARSYRITLPRGRASKQTVISRIRDHIPSLVAVLGQLTREDLSGVALAHGLSDDRRSIDELVARLLAAASGGSPATVDDAAKAGASAAVDDAAKVGSPAPQRTASPRARPEAQRSPAAPTFELARAATQERLARDVPPRPPERTLREPGAPPRAGDLAIVRHRRYWVEAVAPATSTREQTCVELVCLDDDAAGRKLTVLWELELGARVLDPAADGLGVVDRLDPPRHFAAYFNAVRWNCVTATDPGIFQAPFRAGIRIEEHQLAPLQRALALPRANLFIADDVGLGKTIEAGLVLQELLLRQRVDFVLVVAPAAITLQWRGEMARRFGLNFEIVDRAFVSSRRRARGMDVNPWSTHNRFIVSYQTLRRPEYREPLLRFLGPDRKRKSLLVLDEAHTVAPSSNVRTFGDSQLTKDARALAPRFENRLFLSATPHNGHSGSFSALLEILDRQRFTRGVPVSGPAALRPVMVRRLKQDLKAVGRGSFPDRVPVELSLEHNRGAWTSRSSLDSERVAIGAASDAEVALSHLLARYTELAEPEKGDGKFAFITLQKRLLSSI
ncbi:MAG: DEAD/DEAH box helicase family protein, partial [Myxococcales bacterium]|nr:DEAD/DEAH box helicase family protein [Myxococcales bacterium]